MSEWTYHAQDALTGAWISRNLPLIDVEVNDVLTGHCSLKARIAPQDPTLALMPEWGTFIYAEKGNTIRGGYILAGSTISEDGEALDLDLRSFTAYAEGQHYLGKYKAWSADPLDCLRELWRWLQARDIGGGLYSNLNLVLDQDTSPVTISDPEPPPKPKAADVTYGTQLGSAYGTAGDPWPRPAKPRRLNGKRPKKRKRRKGETDAHWNAYVSNYNSRLDAWKAKRKSVYTDRLPEWNAWHDRLDYLRQQWEDDYGDREPYTLYWWDQPDVGQEALQLAAEGGFEWRERHTWTDATKTAVNHRLQLGYPTVGTTHTTPLVVGQGIAAVPTITRGGDKWVNAFTVFGAGQGRKMVRATTNSRQGRLIRAGVASYKKAHRFSRAIALARDECNARSVDRYLPEVAIWDTAGDLGTYRLGDVVPITVANGWAAGGTTTTSHKIIGRRYAPDNDDLIFLQLDPAERSNA